MGPPICFQRGQSKKQEEMEESRAGRQKFFLDGSAWGVKELIDCRKGSRGGKVLASEKKRTDLRNSSRARKTQQQREGEKDEETYRSRTSGVTIASRWGAI